jgi:hypothetical protein
MRDFLSYHIQSTPDFMADGYVFEFKVTGPHNFNTKIGVSEDAIINSGVSTNSLEATLSGIFPALLKVLESKIEQNQIEPNATLHLNNEQVQNSLANLNVPDFEKIRNYLAISNKNIFSDPAVPLSIRIISEDTGVPTERIQQCAKQGALGADIKLLDNKFLKVSSEMEL